MFRNANIQLRWFPIRVRLYDTGEEFVCQTPDEVPALRRFFVVACANRSAAERTELREQIPPTLPSHNR